MTNDAEALRLPSQTVQRPSIALMILDQWSKRSKIMEFYDLMFDLVLTKTLKFSEL